MRTVRTLKRRFLNVIFLSMVINLLFSFALITLSGTFERAKTEIYEDFASHVTKEADGLNQLMSRYTTSAIIMANNIDSRVKTLARRSDVGVSELYRSEDMSEIALSFALSALTVGLDTNDISGAFFILRDGDRRSGPGHKGIYIDAPVKLSAQNTYLYERGPKVLADKVGIPLAESWKQHLTLPEGENSFFEILTEHEYDHSISLGDDGYWFKPYDMLGTGDISVSYSVPLLGEDDKVYAILGLAINTSVLMAHLKSMESENDGTIYYISRSDARAATPDWTIAGKKLLNAEGRDILDGRSWEPVAFTSNGEKIGEFEVFENDIKTKHLSCLKELDIPGLMSRGTGGGWSLIGFAPKPTLFKSYYNTMLQVIATSLLAVLGAGFLIYILARKYFDRITGLRQHIVNIDTMKFPKHMDRTNIEEIDSLADAIEDMSKSVSESTLRVATILDLLEMPIGGYEIRPKGIPRVFVTPSIKKMLSLKETDGSMYMGMDEWEKVYNKLKSNPCDCDEGVYCWHPENGDGKAAYFKIEEKQRESSTIGVLIDITGQVLRNMDLEYRATYDSLTMLYNRAAFKHKAVEKIRSAPDRAGIMIFGDLDGLKKINDVYGHSKGDLLIQTAGEMMATLESLGGIVTRLSGDEFAAYVHGFDSKEDGIEAVSKHMSENFNRTVTVSDGIVMPVSISRGISVYPDDSDDFSTLLSFADYTMYQAKFANKGSLRVFDLDAHFSDEVQRSRSEALVKIIEERTMTYTFQPVYETGSKKLAGYSVYMHPQPGELGDPQSILNTAIASCNHERLEEMIFRDMLEWMRGEPACRDLTIFIRTIKNYAPVPEKFDKLYREYSDQFPRLAAIIQADSGLAEEINKNKIQLLRGHGSKVVMNVIGDDLEESLRLLELKPDIVKIGVNQIRVAFSQRQSRINMENIMSICRKDGIRTLATHIETTMDYETAMMFGFEMIQGYFIGHPHSTLTDPGYPVHTVGGGSL